VLLLTLRREVHVWSAELDGDAALPAVLSEDERERARRFRLDRDRNRFAVCRGWLRVLLSRYTQLDPAAIRFGYGAQGKPYVEGGPHFNVSHSGGVALLAFCAGAEVGIDVEELRELTDAAAIARRWFPAADLERWTAAAPQDRQRIFFECWTRMEAIGKANGGGLASFGATGGEWSLFDVSPASEYAATLAVRGSGWTVRSMGQCGGAVSSSEDRSG
jgi:4'-phosphopantetheinyl transferase